MKISNSKKQLAQIIHENGGWYDGATFYCQDRDGEIFPYNKKPSLPRGGTIWHHSGVISGGSIKRETPIKNWHQTILSREEYFHLYPVPDADFPSGDGVTDDTDALQRLLDRSRRAPTIEQRAADYRNRKDYADRKQQEADGAKADAEAKLAELVAAGKALGLVLSVVGVESELVVTDWRDLREGDIIELTADRRYLKTECTVVYVPGVGLRAKSADDTENQWWNLGGRQESEWRFIRRPAKGDANA